MELRMKASVVTVKGQVVIPAKLRRKFRIKRGTRVVFYEKQGELRIVPVTHETVDSSIGFLKTRGRLTRALAEEERREREL